MPPLNRRCSCVISLRRMIVVLLFSKMQRRSSQCRGLSQIPWTSSVGASKGSSVSVWDEPWQPAAGQGLAASCVYTWLQFILLCSTEPQHWGAARCGSTEKCITPLYLSPGPSTVHVRGKFGAGLHLNNCFFAGTDHIIWTNKTSWSRFCSSCAPPVK